MPPNVRSRYRFNAGFEDESNRLFLDEREPFVFAEFDDNRTHIARSGDTLWSIAHVAFYDISDRPGNLWWILADYQPNRILDPTLTVEEGREIVIPSNKTIRERIFSEQRRLG